MIGKLLTLRGSIVDQNAGMISDLPGDCAVSTDVSSELILITWQAIYTGSH